MTAKNQTGRKTGKNRAALESEEKATGRIITAVVIFCAALIGIYVLFASPEAGTAMGSIRDVLKGAGGSMAILIPVFMIYLAVLFFLRARQRPVRFWKSVLYSLLFPLAHALWQIFSTEDIVTNHMTIQTFANYLKRSFSYGGGGGVIGGLLAWPAYRFLGVVGGAMILILLILLVLLATGSIGALISFLSGGMERAADRREERQLDRELFEPERRTRRRPQEDIPWERRDSREVDRGMILPDRTNVRRRAERPAETPPVPERRRTEEGARTRGRNERGGEAREAERRRPAEPAIAVDASVEEEKPRQERRRAEEREFGAEKRGRPEKAERAEKKREEPRQKPQSQEKRKAEAEKRVSEDDLAIEPDHSEVISGDTGPVKPVERGRLKRPSRRSAEEEGQDTYYYPPIDLLPLGGDEMENSREADLQKAALLAETLEEFGIKTRLTGIAHGPAVTRFELQPAPGVKVSRITSLTDDITMHLAATSVRIEAPIPGKAAVGVEVPNENREVVRLRDVLESQEARKSASRIAVGLGKDNSGRYIVADIAKMPHVLIAGQTGAGKSVCINALIISILYRATPEEVKMIMIDPKVVELSVYNDIPHLVCPVVTDCQKAASALSWAVAEMEQRYQKFANKNVRDIKGYNKALEEGEEMMPQMVIIIDELADLMMAAPGEVEDSIQRLAQKARAAGIHLVIATQRPSVNVVTGVIKANIPSRIAFSVSSQVDSRTIIDHAGAEKLLGNGDMLFAPSGINKPMRVQGAWVSDEEVNAIVTYIKERSAVNYDNDMIEKMNNAVRSDAEKEEVESEYDPRLPEAVEIVVEAGQASVSMLQRKMRVGYARAGRLIDEMERRGIVSVADGAKPRTVLITREELEAMFEDEDT